MEGEKKKGKKKWILLIIVGIIIALVATIVISIAVNESKEKKFILNGLNGEWKVLLSEATGETVDGVYDKYVYTLGSKVVFDTSAGLDDTVMQYSINGKTYTEHSKIGGSDNGERLTYVWIKYGRGQSTIYFLSENVCYLSGLSAVNAEGYVKGTILIREGFSSGECKINGNYEVDELTKQIDTYNKADSMTGIRSVSCDNDKLTLGFSGTDSLETSIVNGAMTYTVNGTSYIATVPESGDDYFIMSVCVVGETNGKNMLYRFNKV